MVKRSVVAQTCSSLLSFVYIMENNEIKIILSERGESSVLVVLHYYSDSINIVFLGNAVTHGSNGRVLIINILFTIILHKHCTSI